MKCPMCNNHNFTVRAYAYDAVTCLCLIDEDGPHIVEHGNEDVLDTSWFGNAFCAECGCNVRIENCNIMNDGVELRPYSVLLLYPDRETPETYYTFVHAEDPEKAIIIARGEAKDANEGAIHGSDFHLLAVYNGHLIQERGCVY